MDPERVLEKIEEKDSISVFEAERGVLASLLHAERRQAKRHPGSIEDTFGHSFSPDEIEDFLRSEFQDLVQDAKGSRSDITPGILEEAVQKLDDRIGVEAWDEDIVDEHQRTCKTLIERSGRG